MVNATGHAESGTGDDAAPFLDLDQGIYPMYPNAAGVAWIDLVKKEWNSTELEIPVGATEASFKIWKPMLARSTTLK